MAKRNYLVEGLSAVNKSAVHDELVRRGHHAISTDPDWTHSGDPGSGSPTDRISHDTWMWDRQKAVEELASPEPDVLFVCGSSRNRDDFLHYFTKVFDLRIDDDTLRQRLEARTDDDWPLGPEGVDLMLELNRSDQGPAGAIDVDATRPLDEVVDDLLRLAAERRGHQAATVVAARPEHLEAVVRIWHGGWGDAHHGRVPAELLAHRTVDEFRRMATERLPRTWVAVPEGGAEGEAVGFVVVHHDEVDQLYVEADWRGRGVAARLLDHAEALIAREHRVAWLAVVAGNQRALRFYERRGWRDGGGIDHRAETATGTLAVPARRYEKAVARPT